jgi:hypothetical protein
VIPVLFFSRANEGQSMPHQPCNTHLGESGLIHPSAWNRNSPKSGQPRSNTYERPWLRSASFEYYLAFHHFLIIPIGRGLRHGWS